MSTDWRATYARRFRRMELERPSNPIGIKSYAEWSDEEINALATAEERTVALRWREWALMNRSFRRAFETAFENAFGPRS